MQTFMGLTVFLLMVIVLIASEWRRPTPDFSGEPRISSPVDQPPIDLDCATMYAFAFLPSNEHERTERVAMLWSEKIRRRGDEIRPA